MKRYSQILVLCSVLAVPVSFSQSGSTPVQQNQEIIDLLTEIRDNSDLIADGIGSAGSTDVEFLEVQAVTLNLLFSVALGFGVTIALYRMARHG